MFLCCINLTKDSHGVAKRLIVKSNELLTLDPWLRVIVEFDDLNAEVGES